MNYRADIDGLRAVAIVPVVLFHAGYGAFSGGYVGVDVFFVISGYLITGLLLSEMRAGNFSFSNFYERRIRRLLPAFVPVAVFSWVCANLFLMPSAFSEFAGSLLASILGFANWFFLAHVGYFDGPAGSKPLLHMWSLAVEEQFYLVFPILLLVLLARVRTRGLLWALSLIAAASLAGACWLVWNGLPDHAFYNSAVRIWELMAGAIVACMPRTVERRDVAFALRGLGLTMIAIAVFAFDKGTAATSVAPLLPVLGTVFVILASSNARDPFAALLSSRPMVALGRVSYGLYLWHWPILVFLPMAFPHWAKYGGPWPLIAAMGLSLALAILSYFTIENPIRRKAILPKGVHMAGLFAGSVAVFAALASTGLVDSLNRMRLEAVYGPKGTVLLTLERERQHYFETKNLNFDGRQGAFDPAIHTGYTCSYDFAPPQDELVNCLTGQSGSRTVLVIGDSFGRDTWHSLKRAYPTISFVMLHQSSCPPGEITYGRRKCFVDLLGTVDAFRKQVPLEAIILSFRYQKMLWTDIEASIAALSDRVNNTFLLGTAPVWRQPLDYRIANMPRQQSLEDYIPRTDRLTIAFDISAISDVASKIAMRAGAKFIVIDQVFCPEDRCFQWRNNNRAEPLFWDQFHLTRHGMDLFAEHLKTNPQLQRLFLDTADAGETTSRKVDPARF
ncbi:acyltransferase family protein [Pseudahrensia aquimaris]|uniref:Acyltransferase family protein n=1 Tax=Pseudahrensia aquimaris TaxID=744461 RepID=A0ABW3FD99_9HYPH